MKKVKEIVIENLSVIKVWAVGCNNRFACIRIFDFYCWVRISDELYVKLRAVGVPTSQSLRGKK